MAIISGTIKRVWNGKQNENLPINFLVIDSGSTPTVQFKTSVWSLDEYGFAKEFSDGDEITFSGHVRRGSSYQNAVITVEMVLDKIMSYTKVQRETIKIPTVMNSDGEDLESLHEN